MSDIIVEIHSPCDNCGYSFAHGKRCGMCGHEIEAGVKVEMAYKYDSFNEFYNANEFNIRPEQVWSAARELGDKCE